MTAAIAAAGCERALLVAPTSSSLVLTASASAVPLNGKLAITATLTDATGKPVADGTLVRFTSTLGTLEPVEAYIGNGRATTSFVAGPVSGIASIVASSGGVQSSPIQIRVGSVPARIVLATTASTSTSVTIVATVLDSSGVAISGIPVTFTTTAGTLASSTVNSNSVGQAVNTLYGATDAVVTAEAAGVTASMAVRFAGGGTLSVNIGINPTSPQRRQIVTFTANVTNLAGSPVPIQRYEWDFGGGYVVITTGNTTTRSFDVEGIYTLTLRVYALDGSAGLSQIQFYVD
jgi:hypothetical protein